MKPIPLADLERFLVPKKEQPPTPPATGDESPAGVQHPTMYEISIPLDVLEKALCGTPPTDADKTKTVDAPAAPESRPEMLLPLEALASLSKKKPSSPDTNQDAREQPVLPLEAFKALVRSIGPNAEPLPETSKPVDTSHIVDLTDQFIGRSLIITGAVKPPEEKK